MTKKLAALGLALLLLAGLAGCSSKKSSTEVSSDTKPPATTDDETEGTDKKKDKDDEDDDKPRLKIKAFEGGSSSSGSSGPLTADEEECINEAAEADPVLGPLVDENGEPTTEEEMQALGVILLQCLGQERIGQLVADEVAADPAAAQILDINCIETSIGQALDPVDVVTIFVNPDAALPLVAICLDRAALADLVVGELAGSGLTPDQIECVRQQFLTLSDDLVLRIVEEDPTAEAELQALLAVCAG